MKITVTYRDFADALGISENAARRVFDKDDLMGFTDWLWENIETRQEIREYLFQNCPECAGLLGYGEEAE